MSSPLRETVTQALLLTETVFADVLPPHLAARVVLDINARAKRVSLRVDPVNGCIVLVRPKRMSERMVTAFVTSRVDWIAEHLANLEPRIPFADGVTIPYRGEDHTLRWRPEAKGGVWRDADARKINVTGKAEHSARRLRDWLKAEARTALSARIHAMAESLNVNVTRLSVRDTCSRWGSCNRAGKLSFSWRLILAPDEVLTYVAAHEIAHLKEMNHSPAFWRTVETVLRTANDQIDLELARAWLRRGGATLHRYG